MVMDRGPQFPARDYDNEHRQGHHHRLLLGSQAECDMCRTENRNSARDMQDVQESHRQMQSEGVDITDRDAIVEYRRKKMSEDWDKDVTRRAIGEKFPRSKPKPKPNLGYGSPSIDPRSNPKPDTYGDPRG